MKFTTKLFAFLAFAMIAGAPFAAHADDNDYPVQYFWEMRQIHATHSLHNMHNQMVMSGEEIAPAVLFPTGTDKLTPKAAEAVAKVAKLLKTPAYKRRHVMVSGYTDSKGKDAANQRLSYHRAVTVVKQLEKDGVPAKQLTAQGFGSENPVADNATAEGRAMNRRVTFTLGN